MAYYDYIHILPWCTYSYFFSTIIGFYDIHSIL